MASDDFLEEYNDSEAEENFLFYTPKTIQQIDDSDILEDIFKLFPKLKEAHRSKEDKEERKTFLEFLQSKETILKILDKYHLDILQLMKVCCRHFSYVFNTANYTLKVKSIIENNGYSEIQIEEH